MADSKQTLSPAEWKSVTDYLLKLSERVQIATSSTKQVSQPREQCDRITDVPSE